MHHLRLSNLFIIFFISIFACVNLLLIERLAGIEWDFHPDSKFYIITSDAFVAALHKNNNIFSYVNNFYYVIVALLGSNIVPLILLNILAYAATNIVIFLVFAEFLKAHPSHKSPLFYFFMVLILFDPYRIHLAIHVLKDVLVLFCAVMFTYFSRRNKIWIFIIGVGLRQLFIVNVITMMSKKSVIFCCLSGVVLYSLLKEQADAFLVVANQVNMNVRNVDNIPSYFDEGVLGAFKRGFSWPILYIYGLFPIYSLSILYLPIALQVLSILFFRLIFMPRSLFDIRLFVILFLVALLVSAFTAYVRYALPILYIFLLADLAYKSRTKAA